MTDERAAKVKRYLEWIAPEGGLEAMASEPTLLEGLADVPWAVAADAQGVFDLIVAKLKAQALEAQALEAEAREAGA